MRFAYEILKPLKKKKIGQSSGRGLFETCKSFDKCGFALEPK